MVALLPGERLYQLYHSTADILVGNLSEVLVEIEHLAHSVGVGSILVLLTVRCAAAAFTAVIQPFKKISRLYIQNAAEYPHSAGAHPIRAVLIFLDLLGTQAKLFREFFSRHSLKLAALAHLITDMDVDCMRHSSISRLSRGRCGHRLGRIME